MGEIAHDAEEFTFFVAGYGSTSGHASELRARSPTLFRPGHQALNISPFGPGESAEIRQTTEWHVGA